MPHTQANFRISSFSTHLIDLGPTLERTLRCMARASSKSSPPVIMPFNVSEAAKAYASLIRDKFNQAPIQLVERMGEANWQRHKKMRKQIGSASEKSEEESVLDEDLGGAVSTSLPSSTFHNSGIGTSLPVQTRYTPSHASLISSNTEGLSGRLRVPREPAEVVAGRPFKCHFCGKKLSNIRTRVQWKSVHVTLLTFQVRTHEISGYTFSPIYNRTSARSLIVKTISCSSVIGLRGPTTSSLSTASTNPGVVQSVQSGVLAFLIGRSTSWASIDLFSRFPSFM